MEEGQKETGGWIKIHRAIKDHWIFQNDTFFKWWMVMLLEVNHKDFKQVRGYKTITVKAGQSIRSLREWSNLFNTNTKAVSKFFDLLHENDMIKKEVIGKLKQSVTLVTITNYAQYQGVNETRQKRDRNASDYATGIPYKKGKNDKKEEEVIGELSPDRLPIFFNWLEYRKSIKKAITNINTKESLVKRFNSESLDKCEWVISYSIENQYQGLFWEKYDEKKNGKVISIQPQKRSRSSYQNPIM